MPMPEDISQKVAELLYKLGGCGIDVYNYVYLLQEENDKLKKELTRKNELYDYLSVQAMQKACKITDLYGVQERICKEFYETCKGLGKDIAEGKNLETWTKEYITETERKINIENGNEEWSENDESDCA